MAIIGHEEALTILARSVDPRDPASMLEAIRLLAAICLVPPDGFVPQLTRYTHVILRSDAEVKWGFDNKKTEQFVFFQTMIATYVYCQ